nr:phosphoribosyl-ATP diphosphatase [Cyclobacteriaceae bacterium]
VAQKVGEEAVELIIEAKDDNEELFLNESADLMYHYLVLLAAKGYQLKDVIEVLKQRHKK